MAIPTASVVVAILCISPVLSVCQYGLLGHDTTYLFGVLGLVVVVSSLVLQKVYQLKSGRPLDPDKPGCITSCRGRETNPKLSRPFFVDFCP